MLTLQQLKQIVDVPDQERKTPTAKKLRESGSVIAKTRLEKNVEITVYRNGYVLYQVDRRATVFPITLCQEYLYEKGDLAIRIPEKFFEQEIWYMRLVLEGEDRLTWNEEVREQTRNISYSAISEEWSVLGDTAESALEYLMKQETVEELLSLLTERQRVVVRQFYLHQKTQKQIAQELKITAPAVSVILSQALRRLRKKCVSVQHLDGQYLHRCGSGKGE